MLTNKCNLSCSYCFQQHAKKMILWTDDSLDHMLESLIQLDSSHCWDDQKVWDWFGGEPLIYKDLILERQNKNTINSVDDITFALTTNATLITPEFIDEYPSYNNAYIHVSFDSAFLEHDLRNHTENTVVDVLKSMNHIANVAGPYNTSVGLTINPRLIPTMGSTLELLYRSGVRNFNATPLIYNKNVMEDWTSESLAELCDIFLKFGNIHKDTMITFGAEVTPKATTNCGTGGKLFAIDGSGDISGCFFFSNDKEKHGDIILANIFSGLINPRYDQLATMATDFYETNEKCKTCNIQDLCYIRPAGIKDTTGDKYFESNNTCQDVIRLNLQVDKMITEQNIPFRNQIIDDYNK